MRLIDADLTKKNIEEAFIQHRLGTFTIGDVCDCIDSQPTIEAEPVVRCKDCKYLFKDKMLCLHNGNRVFNTGIQVCNNHYCSYGAKMDEEQG